MLNRYTVKVWHLREPNLFDRIEVRTYSARRAEDLARESYPCCLAAAEQIESTHEHPLHASRGRMNGR